MFITVNSGNSEQQNIQDTYYIHSDFFKHSEQLFLLVINFFYRL